MQGSRYSTHQGTGMTRGTLIEDPMQDHKVTGLFCVADETRHTNWKFVGEGKGGYTQEQVYNFVGEHAGAFDRIEHKYYNNWRPRLCTLAVVAALLGLTVLWALARFVNTTMGENKQTSQNPQRPVYTVTPVNSSSTQSTPTAASAHFNCMTGFKTGWSDEKKNWCCVNAGMGCTPNGPIAPLTNVGMIGSTLQGCDTRCVLHDVNADCGERVRFTASQFVAQDDAQVANSCNRAYEMVLVDCMFCSVCLLQDSGCSVPTV